MNIRFTKFTIALFFLFLVSFSLQFFSHKICMIWFDFRVLVAIKCNLYIKWNVDNGQIHLTNGKNFKISIFTADQSMENEKKTQSLHWMNHIGYVFGIQIGYLFRAICLIFLLLTGIYELQQSRSTLIFFSLFVFIHWKCAIGRNCSYWAVTNYISQMTMNGRMTKNNRIKAKRVQKSETLQIRFVKLSVRDLGHNEV